jgi:hypothetical protein
MCYNIDVFLKNTKKSWYVCIMNTADQLQRKVTATNKEYRKWLRNLV